MSLYPRNLNEYVASLGIPRGPLSKAYLVDTVNGNDNNSGTSWQAPLLTLTEAEDRCVGDRHDAVLFLSGDIADNPAAAIAWDKDYTHLIGLSSDLPGLGQRCRVVGTAAADLTNVINFSGNGCIVKNMQFYNGADADVDNNAMTVSGDRCHFKNVMAAGMMHTTPAARAGSSSATLSGAAENLFEYCTLGTDTVLRASTNVEMILTSSSKNTFRKCRFMTYSETAGHGLVSLVNSAAGINFFEDSLFYSLSVNWATPIDNAFLVTGTGATYYVDLCRCRLIGVDGWSDVVTHFYTSDPLPHASAGVPTNPTT
jgi:hypothetical protein